MLIERRVKWGLLLCWGLGETGCALLVGGFWCVGCVSVPEVVVLLFSVWVIEPSFSAHGLLFDWLDRHSAACICKGVHE